MRLEHNMYTVPGYFCLIKKFFQISSFVYSRTNKHIEVWNNFRVSK